MGKNFLIIQTGFLGDAILASGLIRAIRAADAGHGVGLLVRNDAAELYTRHSGIDILHHLDKKSKTGITSTVADITASEYDVAIVPHRSYRSASIAKKGEIPIRVGFRQSEAPWFFSHKVLYDISLHETARNGTLLEAVGIAPKADDIRTWLEPQPELQATLQSSLGELSDTFLIAPGSVWGTKRWVQQGFADVARELRARGHKVLLIGSRGERGLCMDIAQGAGVSETDVLAGGLSLPELLVVVSMARRVITNDSAPLHLAESVGVPVTAIFGPTVPQFGFGPTGTGSFVVERAEMACRPCRIHGGRQCPIGTHLCMAAITAADVLNNVPEAQG